MMRLYNTLKRKKEDFVPLVDKKVGFYSCGPTIYNYAHIGNFRAYIAVDLFKRYLKFKGYLVNHIMNLTDVDDKTIKGAKDSGVSLGEFTKRYGEAFFEDIKTLNIDKADLFPRATEHIKEMVDIIKILLDKGIAYKADDGSIYFSVSKFKEYGKLSHTKFEGLQAGARVKHDEYEKGSLQDFALWKAWDENDGDVFWDEDIGKGRPGWHIECSAMSTKYLGQPFDVHGGGVDLVFPHHENEIAQSEAAFDKPMSKYWFHNEHLQVDGKKMSKSLGNFFTLRDLLDKGYNPIAIRYLLLSVHYRQQLNFTEDAVTAADNAVKRLNEFVGKLRTIRNEEDNSDIKTLIDKAKKGFEKEMDDDLNISSALAAIFDFVKDVNTLINEDKIGKNNSEEILSFMKKIDSVLGVIDFAEEEIPKYIKELVDKRESARKQKNWEESDKLRDKLKEKGYEVKDSKEGPVLRKV